MDNQDKLNDLQEVSQELLYNTFIESFGDYKLNVKITYQQFIVMLERSGYSPEISFGHFFKGELIGFLINGKRMIDSNLYCYVIAAGYLPQFRSHFRFMLKLHDLFQNTATKLNAKSFITEVLRDNTPIISILNSRGWKKNKNLVTFLKIIDKPINTSFATDITITKERTQTKLYSTMDVNYDDIELSMEKKLDFIYQYKINQEWISWQNSIAAIRTIIHNFIIISIKKKKEYLGYGIINKFEGDISQFVINEEDEIYADLLLSSLIQNTEAHKVGFINIDENDWWLSNFLKKNKFTIYSSSYEYVKEIT